MLGDVHGASAERDRLGRYRPGNNTRKVKQERIAAKAEELRREYFPNGGMSVMDGNRLLLAAKHYFTAETCRDHLLSQRATRCAEYLVSKLRPSSAPPRQPAGADQAALALELLLNKPDGV
jgi:hypothetical protein